MIDLRGLMQEHTTLMLKNRTTIPNGWRMNLLTTWNTCRQKINFRVIVGKTILPLTKTLVIKLEIQGMVFQKEF